MIYFVQADRVGNIKIGFTDGSPSARLSSLQTASPVPLRLLGSMPGDRETEAALHLQFKEAREQGEWFRPVPELLLFIAGRAGKWPKEFGDLVKICPALGRLWAEALAYHQSADPTFCANAVWYGYDDGNGIKKTLCELVGWEAALRSLRTMEAYDIAYETIYEALPDCRGDCSCVSVMRALFS